MIVIYSKTANAVSDNLICDKKQKVPIVAPKDNYRDDTLYTVLPLCFSPASQQETYGVLTPSANGRHRDDLHTVKRLLSSGSETVPTHLEFGSHPPPTFCTQTCVLFLFIALLKKLYQIKMNIQSTFCERSLNCNVNCIFFGKIFPHTIRFLSPPLKNALIFSPISQIHLCLASYAPHAMCGVRQTLSISFIR